MKLDRKIEETLENGLASVGKLKILRLLLKNPNHAFTRYEIGKKISNDPTSIRNNLKTLVKIDWVIEFKVQHLSKYSINLNNEIVKGLANFLREIKYIH